MHILDLMKNHPHNYEGIQPYIFEKSDKEKSFVEPTDEILASPFPKFSIEIDGDAITSSFGSFETNIIYCEELAPDDYLFIIDMCAMGQAMYMEFTSSLVKVYQNQQLVKTETSSDIYNEYKGLVKHYLDRLRAGKLGLTNAAGKAKYKADGKKHTYKPNNVIYCSNKKFKGDKNAPKSRNYPNVRWQESWTVEAHWRRISPDKLGLDRYGNRTVMGLTWIDNYAKGEGSLMFKIRKVK